MSSFVSLWLKWSQRSSNSVSNSIQESTWCSMLNGMLQMVCLCEMWLSANEWFAIFVIDSWSTNKVYLFNQIEEIIFRLLEQQLAYCGFFLHRRTHHALIDALNSFAQGARSSVWTTNEKRKEKKKQKRPKTFFSPNEIFHHTLQINGITGLIWDRQTCLVLFRLQHSTAPINRHIYCIRTLHGSSMNKRGQHLNYFHSIQCRSVVCVANFSRWIQIGFFFLLTPNCIQFEQMMIVFDAKWEYWNQFVFCAIW